MGLRARLAWFVVLLVCARGAAGGCSTPGSCGIAGFVHVTPSRHVTVMVRMGRVLEGVLEPGLHVKGNPFTRCFDILVQEQLDSVRKVQCGTRDGILLEFDSIDIHNALPAHKAREMFLRYGPSYDSLVIYDFVKFFVGQICANMTAEEVYLTQFNTLDDQLQDLLMNYQTNKSTGIEISKVKFYKPRAPHSTILREFQKRAEAEAERVALLSEHTRIVQANENQLERKRGENAQQAADNTARLQREVDNKKAERDRQAITLAMERDAAGTRADLVAVAADAEATRVRKLAEADADARRAEADANIRLLTPQYLSLKQAEALTTNSKLIVGNDIPSLAFLPPADWALQKGA